MSTICATKRDLERIAKKRYVFDERLFNVYIIHKGNTALNLGQEYSIKKEGDYYYLYNLLSNTGCYLDPLILIDVVCENYEVLITNEVVSKPARGRLILKNHLYDKTTTKDEVESSDCTIKPEFLDIVSEFTDNRIIQELYIGEPINASVWYDSRYLDIVRINESFFFPTKNAGDYTGLADRTGSDKYSNEQLKDLARSTFICKVGDYLKIKNISEKTIVLQKLLSYDSYSELLITNYVLSPNEYFDFAVREDCFVVFNILNLQGTLDGYWLTSSCPSDYNFKLTANSADITNTKKFVSKNQNVPLLASISNYYIYDYKEGFYYLNDGSGDTVLNKVSITFKITKPDGSLAVTDKLGLPPSFSTTSFNNNQFIANVSYFTPDSNCHVEVIVRFTTDSGDIELENDNGSNPGYTLYIKGNVPITINNKTYLSDSSILFDSDSNLTASWSLDSELYDVLLQYYTGKYYLKNYLTESKSISFDMIADLILTVNTVSADCVYEADKKVILQLDFEPGNSVKLHKSFNYNKTHIIDTENQVYSSSMPNEFLNSDITSISYYTDKEQFVVTSKAFKDCTQLNTVSIEGPQLQINNEAFKNTIALNEVKGIENTLFLGNLAFYNSGLKLFHSSNTNLTTINLSAFEECNRLLKVLLNELNLASIRESAFKNTPSLKLVKLPKNINSIEKEAFAYSGINKIVTSDLHSLATDGFWFVTDDKTNGLSVIEEGVFKGCTSLKDIELPDSIEHLETLSFAECDNIQNFSSPGLKTIALEAFKDTWVEGVVSEQLIEDENANSNFDTWSSKLFKINNTSGILFDTVGQSVEGLNKNFSLFTYISPDETNTNLILYSCYDKLRGGILDDDGWNYNLHQNTISISPHACSGNLNIQNFQCLESNRLTNIGDYAFKDNRYIRHISMPESGSVLNLGTGAFYGCTRLSEVTQFTQLPIVKIPDYCFYKCGDNKYGIGASMDAGFMNLEFYIPDSVTEIGNYAFADCPQLMAIANLPTCKITRIGDYAFKNCFNNTAWKASYNQYLAQKITYYTMMIIMTVCSFGIAGAANAYLESLSWVDGVARPALLRLAERLGIDSLKAAVFANDLIGVGIGGAVSGVTIGAVDAGVSYNDGKALRKKARSNTVEVPFPYLSELGKGCFQGCEYVSTIVLNKSLVNIPDFAFKNCEKLTRLVFVDEDFTLGQEYKKFLMPSLTTVGKYSFYKCKNLDYDFVALLLKSTESIEAHAFHHAKMFLADEENAENTLAFVIPESLKTIEDSALAFSNRECSTAVFISQNPNKLSYDPNMFGIVPIVKNIIVPEGSLNHYEEIFGNKFKIVEVPLSDEFWKLEKLLGYTIPWLTD